MIPSEEKEGWNYLAVKKSYTLWGFLLVKLSSFFQNRILT